MRPVESKRAVSQYTQYDTKAVDAYASYVLPTFDRRFPSRPWTANTDHTGLG